MPITSDEDDCVYPVLGDDTVMECERNLTFWDVNLGDLNDSLDNQTTRPGHLNVGEGNDVVQTGGNAGSTRRSRAATATTSSTPARETTGSPPAPATTPSPMRDVSAPSWPRWPLEGPRTPM